MSRRREVILPLLLAALGGISMFAGGYRGELKIMFAKAINICLECVGIG
ncbi:CD1871A family CXXC motif-containing protein [Clostridium phoceensis]|nr:CD1871A family CXXC motif-containing protein [Clostridium phoceensis]